MELGVFVREIILRYFPQYAIPRLNTSHPFVITVSNETHT